MLFNHLVFAIKYLKIPDKTKFCQKNYFLKYVSLVIFKVHLLNHSNVLTNNFKNIKNRFFIPERISDSDKTKFIQKIFKIKYNYLYFVDFV